MDSSDELKKYKRVNRYGNFNGVSYKMRVRQVNKIYDEHIKSGISNRQIWRLYIHPLFGISERTFYNYLKQSVYE